MPASRGAVLREDRCGALRSRDLSEGDPCGKGRERLDLRKRVICVARLPGPRGRPRLENWLHAQNQGAVAGRNAAGASAT